MGERKVTAIAISSSLVDIYFLWTETIDTRPICKMKAGDDGSEYTLSRASNKLTILCIGQDLNAVASDDLHEAESAFLKTSVVPQGATDMSHLHEVASELKHTALSERQITGDSDSWHDADLVTSWRVDLLV